MYIRCTSLRATLQSHGTVRQENEVSSIKRHSLSAAAEMLAPNYLVTVSYCLPHHESFLTHFEQQLPLQVVGQLRAKLADTTKGFQEVMTVRQDNLKAHQGRRQLFSAIPDGTTNRPRPSESSFPSLSHSRMIITTIAARLHNE